jgi:hypothetical protein
MLFACPADPLIQVNAQISAREHFCPCSLLSIILGHPQYHSQHAAYRSLNVNVRADLSAIHSPIDPKAGS